METLKKQAAKLLGEQKKYRRWLAVFLCLAVAVTAGTTAALKMNGQALSHEKKVLACGMEVHVHTAECYESGIIPGESALNGEQPICGYADYVVHTHDASCYDEGGDLVCQLPEVKPHVHTESCFEKQMILICGEEEAELHQHTDACRELICGQEETETVQVHQHTEECRALICETEESEGHQHTDACRAVTQGELICENTEEGHEHTAECYEQVETIICGQEETEGHVHTDECYNMQACGLEEETEGHTHTEECYGPYICGQEETEGHTHTDACYQVKEIAVCGELELHTHMTGGADGQGSCYDAQGNLICGIPELKEHVHGEECFEIIEVKDDEEAQLVQKVYEDAEIRVTAEYKKDANIPEEAELVAERMETDVQEPEGTGGDFEAQEAGTDVITEEVSYRLKFLVAGTEIEPESTVSFVVHGLDGEGNDTGELVMLVYKAGDGLDTMRVTLTRETAEDSRKEDAGSQPYKKVYEDAEIRVTAEYGEEANIPEEAEFVAERIETVAQATDGSIAGEDSIQEPVEEEVSYRLRFLVDGAETEPEGTVKFTAQALDEDGNEAGEPVELIYNAGDGLDAMAVTLIREIAIEAQQEFRQEAEAGNVRVIAEYDSEAKIPEEAQLQATLITADENPDSYGEFEAMYLEQAGENAAMDMLLDIGFYVGDEKVTMQAPVSVKVQMTDSDYDTGENVNVFCIGDAGVEKGKAAVAAEEDGSKSISFKDDNLTAYMIGREAVSLRKECRNEALNIIVIAEYGPEAEIPANAELKAEEITAESDPEHYAQREAEYLEQAGEGAVMDMLLNIGFYVDGTEVEPKAPVSVTIQMLDGQYEDGEQMNVVHFGDEATEKLEATDIRTDEEGNKVTSFETNSFSNYALGRSSNVSSLESGREYVIYCEVGNKKVALSHKDDILEAVEVTIDEGGALTGLPEGYTEADLTWEYSQGYYFGEAILQYGSGENKHYIWDDPMKSSGTWQWCITSYSYSLKFEHQDGSDIFQIRGPASGYSLNYTNNRIEPGMTADATGWKFIIPSKSYKNYTVKYYKNEHSVENRQNGGDELDNPGTCLGSLTIPVEEVDGSKVVRVPLTGITDMGYNIGDLSDVPFEDYFFYGWSQSTISNYAYESGRLIYCGEPIDFIDGITVPTYVSEGQITIDVSDIKGDVINLYAAWAVPGDVSYKDVAFYIRFDGIIPNEPGAHGDASLDATGYTSAIVVPNALFYWMHIYGSGNAAAVEANLKNRPSTTDILNRLKEAENAGKQIRVGNEVVSFWTEKDGKREYMSEAEFNAKYYISWYVCKDGVYRSEVPDKWHIDGVLLKKDNWILEYVDNGVTKGTLIPGKQYSFIESGFATVNNTYVNGEESDIVPERTGYTFVNWNTKNDGSGVSFSAGNEITVDSNGQVYRRVDGEFKEIEGLSATRNDNGVWVVSLYPQWAKGTNLLTVTKTDLNGVKLNGAKFKLYKCELTEEGLVRDSELTTEGGSVTSGNGTLTIHNLENDTFYCLEESYAPNGYEQRNMIYFKVEVSEDQSKVMEIHIKDESGEDVAETEKPTWLTATYQPKDTSGTGGLASINFTIADEAILQTVTFKKTDADGNTLKGAEFSLYKEVSGEDEASSYALIGISHSSGEDGVFSFYSKDEKEVETPITTLSYGKYKLEETKAPNGYSKVTVYFEINDPDATKPEGYQKGMVVMGVEVDGKGAVDFDKGKYSVDFEEVNTSVDNNGDNIPATRYSYELTVANMPGKQTVALRKLGNDGEKLPLPGAKFSLYEAKDDKVPLLKNIISDKDGMAELGELDCGEYFLVEEKAPDGYILPAKPIKITVTSEGVVTDSGTFKPEETTDGKTICVVPIYNSTGIVLPETGGPGTTMYTLGGFAVIAASLMYGLSMRRKKEKGGCH